MNKFTGECKSLVRDNGWNEEQKSISELIEYLVHAANLKYELESCVVGGSTWVESPEDLADYIRDLSLNLKSVAADIEDMIDTVNDDDDDDDDDDDE